MVLVPPYRRQVLDLFALACSCDEKGIEPCREQIYLEEAIKNCGSKVLDLGIEYNYPNAEPPAIIYHDDSMGKVQYNTIIMVTLWALG